MQLHSRAAYINQLLVYTLTMLFFTGSIGLGTVWLRHEISLTANNNKVVELRIAEVERHLNEVNAEIDSASTPQELSRQNAGLHLGLVAPNETQVVRFAEQPEIRLAAKRRSEIYADATFVPVIFRRERVR